MAVKEVKIPTEKELLKMPESAYMNEAQLAFFRERLRQMEQDILSNAGQTTEHLRETVIVPDPADRATIEEEHALPRAQVAQKGAAGNDAYRRGGVRLLRRNRRAHRGRAPDGPTHRNLVARGAAAPRIAPENVR